MRSDLDNGSGATGHARRSDAGFTLVEIVVAIVLVGVLGAVVVVGVGRLTTSGSSAACATSADAARTAVTNHLAMTGSQPTSFSQMVSSGALSVGAGTSVGPTGLTLDGNGWSVLWFDGSGSVPRFECTSAALGAAGLSAQVYSSYTFTNPTSTFTHTTASAQNWGNGGPQTGLTDYFSIRYTGNVTVPSSGLWTFVASVDDSMNVWINGQPLFTGVSTRQIVLAAGTYPIRIDYAEWNSRAFWNLSWTPPGGTSTPIPASAFTSSAISPALAAPGVPSLRLDRATATAASFIVTPGLGGPEIEGSSPAVLTCTAPGQPTRTSTFNGWNIAVDGLTSGVAYSCTATLNGSAASAPVTVTPAAPTSAPGLTAVLYGSYMYANPVAIVSMTTDASTNWGYGGPLPGLVDYFSLRYTGVVTIPSSGSWGFTSLADDSITVRVNGQLVVSGDASASVTLAAGTYPIRIDFAEWNSPAYWSLSWTPPGGTSTPIPASAFATS